MFSLTLVQEMALTRLSHNLSFLPMRLAEKSPQKPALMPHWSGGHPSQFLLYPDSICGGLVMWRSLLLAVRIRMQQYAVALHVMIQTPQLDLHLADAETRLRLQFFFKLKYFLKADAVNKILHWKSLISHPHPPLFLKSLQKQISQHSKKLLTVLWWTGS